MIAHNSNEGSRHTDVGWFLWYAADSAHALGQLVAIDYSDSTPDVAFTYDRLGRQLTVTDVLGIRTNVYSPPTSSKSATPTAAPSTPTKEGQTLLAPGGEEVNTGVKVNYPTWWPNHDGQSVE